ncbi:MAG: SEC-C domain-containing protein [Bryobacterales bacterium]|nr:SEC-C domain-containing protein [Bryobacterales bacterium]
MYYLAPKQMEVLQALSSGLSITAAAETAGIHRTTVHHWCRTIPEFRNTLDAVRQARADAVRDAMHELVAPSLVIITNILNDASNSPSLRLRAAMAVIKFAAATQKSPAVKGVTAEILSDISYEAGVKQGIDYATAQSEPEESEIHHNSSLSSENTPSDESEPYHSAQIPRNALCPCGSGNKYKRCCGKSAPPVLSQAA